MKKVEVNFVDTRGDYDTPKKIYLKMEDRFTKEDVLLELIRRGYAGEVINITEVK